jgi:hypothetical protein
MEQFIVVELISVYHKKYKYDDFDWVVRAIIRRKVLDFVSYYIRRNKDLIFTNQTHNNFMDSYSTSKNECPERFQTNNIFSNFEQMIFDKNQKSLEIIDYFKVVNEKINSLPNKVYFSDWDRELMEVALELYEYGYNVSKDDLLECLGFESDELHKFSGKLNSFRNKVSKYIEGETKDEAGHKFNEDIDVSKTITTN